MHTVKHTDVNSLLTRPPSQKENMLQCNLSACLHSTGLTFSKVLNVVVVDFAKTPVFLDQVALGATQVDLTVLQCTTHTRIKHNVHY